MQANHEAAISKILSDLQAGSQMISKLQSDVNIPEEDK